MCSLDKSQRILATNRKLHLSLDALLGHTDEPSHTRPDGERGPGGVNLNARFPELCYAPVQRSISYVDLGLARTRKNGLFQLHRAPA